MLELPGFPPLEGNAIPAWDGQTLRLSAPALTDLFSDPSSGALHANAPYLTFLAQGDFLLSARVWVDFRSTFDAGVLLIYQSPSSWAKLCFEYSPQNQPMVVSVVTKGVSDDCNSVVLSAPEIYLRIARMGRAFAFHYSPDGQFWHLVRHFALEPNLPTRAGFLVQAPRGEGCRASFSQLELAWTTLEDIRSGV